MTVLFKLNRKVLSNVLSFFPDVNERRWTLENDRNNLRYCYYSILWTFLDFLGRFRIVQLVPMAGLEPARGFPH